MNLESRKSNRVTKRSPLAFRLIGYSTFPIPSRGFTVLFAVLVGSLLFSIGLAIAHLSLREIVLSAAGKQSETAFFAADTGVECALYFDLRVGNTFPNSDTAPRDADGLIECSGSSVVALTFLPATSLAATTTFRILTTDPACADVTVGKVKAQGQIPQKVVIEARGRNDCGTGVNPARVERALRVRY